VKKIDKLVLMSFWGPFFLTLAVVIFIFLMRLIMVYIEEFVSKDISFTTFATLLGYFSLLTVPTALPLAILLSSLMTFGNLGEFFELTALKSAGISLTRALRPLIIVAFGLSLFSFWFNNKVSPWANLKGYSLLYDIKTTKATLNLKEGIFYSDLPGYSIKVDKKSLDGVGLRGMVIYKHPATGVETGNREVILADSGRMYTDPDQTFLTFELFNGNNYQEQTGQSGTNYAGTASTGQAVPFLRNGFTHYRLIISLESFGMKRTDEQQFQYHEYMKDVSSLRKTTDSLRKDFTNSSLAIASTARQYYNYQFKSDIRPAFATVKPGKWIDSLLRVAKFREPEIRQTALQQAQNLLSYATSNVTYMHGKEEYLWRYQLESQHKFTQSVAVFIMFLIGAPLGAIIKKGGFGLPVLISIICFIFLYVLTLTGDKYAQEGVLAVPVGAWLANGILFPLGLYLMRQARYDSRLFDKDAYLVAWGKFKARFNKQMGLRTDPKRQSTV
jgi:lipopolysaccharide export system permease protein